MMQNKANKIFVKWVLILSGTIMICSPCLLVADENNPSAKKDFIVYDMAKIQCMTPAGQRSLDEVLNPDGTLKLGAGIYGSFDPEGFGMFNGPDGEPRFMPASEMGSENSPLRYSDTLVMGDENWDQFSYPYSGVNDIVYAIAVSGSAVYVGGEFTEAGGVNVNYIAKWDGTSWSALGNGVNGTVYAISVSGTDIYVGGRFSRAGGVSASRIAKWDGTSWSVLGRGVNGTVYAISVSGTDVYAGGNFTTASGMSAGNIARWDGNSWSTLASGVNDIVRAIAISGSEVYVGGDFTMAGKENVNYIAKWDGISWSALSSGVNSASITAIAVSGRDVYVGGDFSHAGGVSASRIAKWDGTTWSSLARGVSGHFGERGMIHTIAVSGNDVYVGGNFGWASSVSANCIAKWDGTSWSALGNGVGGISFPNVFSIAISGNDVYVGGIFIQGGEVDARNIARCVGTAWSAFETDEIDIGIHGMVRSIAVSGSDVYVGGDFTHAGKEEVNYIAKWDGTSWSALGEGVNDFVWALAVSGSDVYAGGSFTEAGGVSASRIARWDGTSWSALGGGVNGAVRAIAISGNDVYMGGFFTQAGGISAGRIAMWDGSSWSALGSGVGGGFQHVNAIVVSESDVYVGGAFTEAGGESANRIAKWDGTSWSALGSGVGEGLMAHVNAISVSGSDVYVGGSFTEAGGESASRIAKWDAGTETWSAMGSGVNDWVYAVAVSGSDVYVGGGFTEAGGESISRISKWDSSTESWSTLGSGVNGLTYPTVRAISVSESGLYVGGNFSEAGRKPSNNFARWSTYFDVSVTITPEGAATITGDGSYNTGDEVTLIIEAAEGFTFINWTDQDDNVVSEVSTYTFTMPASDVALFANLESDRYTVTVTIVPEGAGTVTGEGTYNEGDEATLEVVANEGYDFINWTDTEGEEIYDDPVYSFIMPATDVEVIANMDVLNFAGEAQGHYGNISLFPNPATDEFVILSEERMNVIEIAGYDGKVVYTKEINGREIRVPTGSLQSGVYIVRIRTGKGVYFKRVVIL